MDYFGLQTRSYGRKEKEEGEEEEGRERSSQGMNTDFCMEIMDSSMILVQELLGYGLLGFHLDLNLIPFL